MQQDTMNLVDTIKVEHEDNNNYSCHNGLTVRNGVNMNLYGIEKRNTIENAYLMFYILMIHLTIALRMV